MLQEGAGVPAGAAPPWGGAGEGEMWVRAGVWGWAGAAARGSAAGPAPAPVLPRPPPLLLTDPRILEAQGSLRASGLSLGTASLDGSFGACTGTGHPRTQAGRRGGRHGPESSCWRGSHEVARSLGAETRPGLGSRKGRQRPGGLSTQAGTSGLPESVWVLGFWSRDCGEARVGLLCPSSRPGAVLGPRSGPGRGERLL